jgi:4-hydroxy-tetrahydrodipicolinate reductase
MDQSGLVMGMPIKLLIFGASGRMGQALVRLAAANPALQIITANGRAQADQLDALPAFDVAIDFSSPAGFDAILALCVSRQKALVSGTTGLQASQFAALERAGASIPVLWASNYSLGVAVLNRLVAQAGHWLSDWQLDILESHHIHKIDAPSGTALSLGETAKLASGNDPVYHSLRGGDIIGEHTVQFTGPGERIELVHRATNRDIFAQGALMAAQRLAVKAKGLYRFDDLLT